MRWILGLAFGIASAGFIWAAIITPPDAMTDDGAMPLAPFFALFAVGFLIASLAAITSGIVGAVSGGSRRDWKIGEGVVGTAVIEGFDDLGSSINDDPGVRLRLRVQVGSEAAYPVQTEAFVPRLYVGLLTAGRPLRVWVDPENSSDLAIDWAGPSGGLPVSSAARTS